MRQLIRGPSGKREVNTYHTCATIVTVGVFVSSFCTGAKRFIISVLPKCNGLILMWTYLHVRNAIHNWINLTSEFGAMFNLSLTCANLNLPIWVEEIGTWKDRVGMMQREDGGHFH